MTLSAVPGGSHALLSELRPNTDLVKWDGPGLYTFENFNLLMQQIGPMKSICREPAATQL